MKVALACRRDAAEAGHDKTDDEADVALGLFFRDHVSCLPRSPLVPDSLTHWLSAPTAPDPRLVRADTPLMIPLMVMYAL